MPKNDVQIAQTHEMTPRSQYIPQEIALKRVLVCIVLSLCPVFVRAQIANSTSLVGTVADVSNSVVAQCKVTAVEESTTVGSTTFTNDYGSYSIKLLMPGTYDITVERSGYQTVTKTGIILPVNRAVRTDFLLPVGSTSTIVTVTASTPPSPPMTRR